MQAHGKLWQLKDLHRDALTAAGLTRWHMGEIASRIGQIYYEYYTRTSDARMLNEACVWYDTIRRRQYFSEAAPPAPRVLQQLRWYMRFTVVCLLLRDSVKARRPPLLVATKSSDHRSAAFPCVQCGKNRGAGVQTKQLLTEMHTLLTSLPTSRESAEWAAVNAEAWACVEADTLLPQLRPTDAVQQPASLRLSPPEAGGTAPQVRRCSLVHSLCTLAASRIDTRWRTAGSNCGRGADELPAWPVQGGHLAGGQHEDGAGA